jgi:molecular chaperone GrpE (heat shock protein)
MKINISIDLQPHNTAELDTIAQFAENMYSTLNLIEAELENYRQRLERVEEMTTRFESDNEES